MYIKKFNEINEDIQTSFNEYEFGENPDNDLEYYLIAISPNSTSSKPDIKVEEIELSEDEVTEYIEDENVDRKTAIKELIKEYKDEYEQKLYQVLIVSGSEFSEIIKKSHPNY